jgi:hypothetical protein
MARGRKRSKRATAKPAPKKTSGLSRDESRWYSVILAQVEAAGGGITAADESILKLAAQQAARLEKFRDAASKAPLTNQDSHGNTKLNPIHAELRTLEGSFRATLASLTLTPRARKSWRQPPATTGTNEPKENPFLKLLG